MFFRGKILSMLLLLVFLSTSGLFRELLKIHDLAEHYYKHIKMNSSTGLAGFLIGHYLLENGNDKDADEDNKLPFKSIDPNGMFKFISVLPNATAQPALLYNQYCSIRFATLPDHIHSSQYHAAIWQPPRNC